MEFSNDELESILEEFIENSQTLAEPLDPFAYLIGYLRGKGCSFSMAVLIAQQITDGEDDTNWITSLN